MSVGGAATAATGLAEPAPAPCELGFTARAGVGSATAAMLGSNGLAAACTESGTLSGAVGGAACRADGGGAPAVAVVAAGAPLGMPWAAAGAFTCDLGDSAIGVVGTGAGASGSATGLADATLCATVGTGVGEGATETAGRAGLAAPPPTAGVTCRFGCPLPSVAIDRVTAVPTANGALSLTASTISPICNCVSPPGSAPATTAGTGCPAACTSPSAARANCASAGSVAGAEGV